MSHLSGVATIISPRANNFRSVPVSPVSTTSFLPSSGAKRLQRRQNEDFTSEAFHLLAPMISHGITQRRHRVHVDYFRIWIVGVRSHNGELCADRLARTARCANERVIIRLIQRSEYLQLYMM